MSDPRKLVWSPRALTDIRDIWRYYATAASEHTSNRLVLKLHAAADRLCRLHSPGRARDEFGAGVRSALVHPHTIFFRLVGQDLQIIRILHERRDVSAIFDRRKR